jgi:signal transduction histidine kinase
VLQTLALIQRRAGDRSEVMRLARSQERDLRSWINGTEQRTEGLMDRIRQAAVEVERDFGIAVDLSTVGDTDLAREVEAVAAATREALVNAAKFAGVDRIYVLAESRRHEVRVVVRDRGSGFDLAAIDGDRRGIVESIEGRMARHGGSATISSRPGEGTEVDIRLPRGEP